jgi:ribosomal protein S18 acetylase RimI-like enzyme
VAVALWVAEGNDAASALYRSAGFVATGERQPLPSNASVTEYAMRLELPPN